MKEKLLTMKRDIENVNNYSDFVRAIVYKKGKVLLIEENKRSGEVWNFPGGKVERGEQPEVAVCREVNEELGVQCLSAKLLFSDDFVFDGKVWKGWYFNCLISDFNFSFESTTETADFFLPSDISLLRHGIPEKALKKIFPTFY